MTPPPPDATVESFTCPVCGRTSHNPHDVREGYCGACHGFTREQPPPGMRWVLFRGGELDRTGRLLDEQRLEPGMTYELAYAPGRWVYDGNEFQLEAPA